MYVALHEVTRCMVVWCIIQNAPRWQHIMWHQPCQRCKYTTSVDIQKTRYKNLFTHVESHASAVSQLESDALTTELSRLPYYIIIIDRFYIALFSALEQTHCARVWFYMTEQLFIARFWISTEVVYLQRWHGWCHMICCHLGAFCVHHTTMHRVTSCKATYIRCMRV